MRKSRIFGLLMAIVMVCSCFAGCGDDNKNNNNNNQAFDYESYNTVSTTEYNKNLFYLNTLDFQVADPTVIYIDDEDSTEFGYFYAYGTSDLIGCNGFQCWRSKDMTNWEDMGVALKPDYTNTWAYVNYWAPEIIYDPEMELYLLFYNAFHIDTDNTIPYISVAVAEEPYGPFVMPGEIGIRDYYGNAIEATQPVYDFAAHSNGLFRDCIDASPFIDPVSGEKYLYMSNFGGSQPGQNIYGVKLLDWFTPDYTTITQMTRNRYIDMTSTEKLPEESTGVNEGPFMVYDEETETYMMTISIFGYTESAYRVRLVTSKTGPLGKVDESDPNEVSDFKKVDANKGGFVIYTEDQWNSMASAGHHCFVRVGDELFIAYHTFFNRNSIDEGRAIAVDKIYFSKNEDGEKIMTANGPTYSYQPLPTEITGYHNVATEATITTNNLQSGSDLKVLNDGKIKIHSMFNDYVEECYFNEGNTTITLKFDDFVNTRAVMVYNSIDYDTNFQKIDKIELDYKTSKGTATAVATNIVYDDAHYIKSQDVKNPGGAALIEYDTLAVKEIRITLNSWAFGVSEIYVLGDDKAPVAVDSFKKYTYTNPVVGAFSKPNEGVTFGVAGDENYSFGTTWGVELDTDLGMNNEESYIRHNGPRDQYSIFKDVYATKLYAEGYISVWADKSFIKDEWPKIGMVLKNSEGCLFFYIDAANNYTKRDVGYTQSKYGGGDWDWGSTEKLFQLPAAYTPAYTNGQYTKMAILRDGNKVYLLCNDYLVATVDAPRGLEPDKKCVTGFLGFNTGLEIKDYYVTTDSATIDAKLAAIVE